MYPTYLFADQRHHVDPQDFLAYLPQTQVLQVLPAFGPTLSRNNLFAVLTTNSAHLFEWGN